MKSKQKPILKSSILWSFTFFVLFGTSFCKTVTNEKNKNKISIEQSSSLAVPSETTIQINQLEVKSDDILGVWKPKKEDFKVELYKENTGFSGKIVWMKNSNEKNGKPILDKLNPQRNKRSQPILGLEVAEQFEFNTYDKNWEDGMVYNPTTGETMKCTINMIDKNTIELVGFVGFSLSEVKIIWKRVDVE